MNATTAPKANAHGRPWILPRHTPAEIRAAFRWDVPAWNAIVIDPIAYMCMRGGLYRVLSANQASLLSLILGVASGFLAIANIAAAVLAYQASYLFDSIDGRIAKLTGTTSEKGARLDLLADRVRVTAFTVGIVFAFQASTALQASFVAALGGYMILTMQHMSSPAAASGGTYGLKKVWDLRRITGTMKIIDWDMIMFSAVPLVAWRGQISIATWSGWVLVALVGLGITKAAMRREA